MRIVMLLALGLVLFVTSLPVFPANATRTISDQQWLEDLHQIETLVRDRHFKPFHVVAEHEFDAAIEQLESKIGELSETEIIVAMVQIVAMLGDGHTRLHIPRQYSELALVAELGHSGTMPPRFASLKFRQSPVRFELFDNGLFIIAASPKYRDLIGQKVLFLDETPVDKAIDLVRSVSFFENDSRARLMAPDRLALPEVTEILGITASSDRVTLITEDSKSGESKTIVATLDRPGQRLISGAPKSLPLWLSHVDQFRWHKILADDAIYVQVNQFEENPVTPYGDFVADTLAAARAAGVSRFVIDLRHNSGGIGAWVTPFVTGLSRSEFNEYGRLFILVGRNTFSAAQHFMHKFEEFTYAMFVGEPSGAKPSHFSDPKRMVLDNSGLTLRVSTIYWHSWLANDFRDAINPHISAPLSSIDYFEGNDPVLDAALRYQPPATLALQIDEQFRQKKNQNALLLYQRYMSDGTIRNHGQVIPELLVMADKLVDDGLLRPGYFIYFLVNRSFPGNPETESGLARLEALIK